MKCILFARRSLRNIPFRSKMVPGGNLGSAVSTPYLVHTVTAGVRKKGEAAVLTSHKGSGRIG